MTLPHTLMPAKGTRVESREAVVVNMAGKRVKLPRA